MKPWTTACPECGYRFEDDNALGFTHRDVRPPKKDDLTLCNRCGALLIFTSDDIADRVATDAEMERGFSPLQLRLMRMTQERIRARRELARRKGN